MAEFNPRDHFDLTPQQYHGGLDKLWVALGLTTAQDEDVFTLAARAIEKGKLADMAATMGAEAVAGFIIETARLHRILRCTYTHGRLEKVVLYPCVCCGRLTIDEWYARGHKETSIIEVADLDEARDIYRPIFIELHESHYIATEPGSVRCTRNDTYTSRDERDNFIVTGSNCFCHKHRSTE
jgi:hypothetical protein